MTMTLGESYDIWLSDFTAGTIDVNGIETAVYSAPYVDDSRPMVLFVHGFNGDYHGLVPLAYELKNDFRAIFVDLPGHGGSAIPQDTDILNGIFSWGRHVLQSLRENGFAVDAVVGHSFGSLAVQMTGASKIALLNPPFAVSSLSRHSTALLGHAASWIAKAYGSYPAMIRRAQWMMHERTKKTDAIIAWSSSLTRVDEEQFKFQAHLAAAISTGALLDITLLARVPALLILLAEFDNIVDNSTSALALEQLPQALVSTLPTGHVSVFEMPEEIAEKLRSTLR